MNDEIEVESDRILGTLTHMAFAQVSLTLRDGVRALLLVSALLGLVACSTSKRLLKAGPAARSAFLENDQRLRQDAPEIAPFHYSARTMSMKSLARERQCQTIWIAPVSLNYLRPTTQTLTAQQEQRGLYRPTPEMAAKLWQACWQAFTETPGARYRPVSKPCKNCLELRLSVVEFDQTSVTGNAMKTAASMFVGPFSMLASPFVKGSIAIEGKIKIHGSDELLYQFADRESDPITFLSVRSYTPTGFAQLTIKKWAEQLEAMTRMWEQQGPVRDEDAIRLNPF